MNDNYQIAKIEADKVDQLIIDTLKNGDSFIVEAGAGSGKTYSLNRVIEWIRDNKEKEYKKRKQSVICITYTNAAVNVIAERLPGNSFIVPSTIHSFAWGAIKQFQSMLVQIVTTDPDFKIVDGDFFQVKEVTYILGRRYKQDGIYYLSHDDVISLFVMLLDYKKFRLNFTSKYPLILIDEYQDSSSYIINRFIKYFISQEKGPQFGFFGDSWQTIYQMSKACGEIKNNKLKVIRKNANFRSAPNIVNYLNKIRPELPQKSAIDGFEGEITVITCEDYKGDRRRDRGFAGDLLPDILRERLSKVNEIVGHVSACHGENMKTLMLTHKVLATQQGYNRLYKILDSSFRDKNEIFFEFFMSTLEPAYNALKKSDVKLLFDILKQKRTPIETKADKNKWKIVKEKLDVARTKRAIDVLDVVMQSQLFPYSSNLKAFYNFYYDSPDLVYYSVSIKEYLNLDYEEFIKAISFFYPETIYSTEHGVKGEEYDNVVFVISKGWYQYQFDVYAPMILNGVPTDKKEAYIKNRNLFYVCCSRAKKRLFIFISVEMTSTLREFWIKTVGEYNILTFTEFCEKYSKKEDEVYCASS